MSTSSDMNLKCRNCRNNSMQGEYDSGGHIDEECPVCGYYNRTVSGVEDRERLSATRADYISYLEEFNPDDIEHFKAECEDWDAKELAKEIIEKIEF